MGVNVPPDFPDWQAAVQPLLKFLRSFSPGPNTSQQAIVNLDSGAYGLWIEVVRTPNLALITVQDPDNGRIFFNGTLASNNDPLLIITAGSTRLQVTILAGVGGTSPLVNVSELLTPPIWVPPSGMGQHVASRSLPVVLALDQSAIPVLSDATLPALSWAFADLNLGAGAGATVQLGQVNKVITAYLAQLEVATVAAGSSVYLRSTASFTRLAQKATGAAGITTVALGSKGLALPVGEGVEVKNNAGVAIYVLAALGFTQA